MFFKSLKQEILILTLGLTILTIVVTTGLGIFSTKTAGKNAEKATSATLRDQAKESLMQIAESAAERQDLLFSHIRDSANNLTSYTINIYDNPAVSSSITSYWKFDSRVFPTKDGFLINNASDTSTFFIPNFVKLDTLEKKNIELTANLDFVVPDIIKGNKNIAAIYTIDNKGVTRYFPNEPGFVLGDKAPIDYDPRDDLFYKPAAPKDNPDKKIVWSKLYDDVAGRGPMITLAAPVYVKNIFWGIVGIDVFLSDISKTIAEYKPIEGSYAFLIDKEGNTIAFPNKAYPDLLVGVQKDGDKRINLTGSSTPEFSGILKEMMKGSKGFGNITKNGKELFIAYAPLKQTGFSLGVVSEGSVMLKAANDLSSEISGSVTKTVTKSILPISVIIILIASIISVWLVTRIVKPVRQLIEGTHEIGRGNLDYNLQVESKNEIGDLADSFNQMSHVLKKSREDIVQAYEVEKKAHKTLEALGKAKSEFITIAAHQLRTPLTEVRWTIDSLVGGSESLEQKNGLEKMALSTSHLIEIVNDLLNVTEIEGEQFGYTFKEINMMDIINKTIQEAPLMMKDKHLEILFENNTQHPAIIFGDQIKLGIAIRNLVQNAIDYSYNTGKVLITLDQKDEQTIVTVHDFGVGMSPEEQSHLFVKFYRSEQAKKMETDRSGLGLYIVKGIIEKHNGTLKISSDIGVGTTVVITLPRIIVVNI